VQGGQNYFRFVEGTCIIALCLSSLSLSLSLSVCVCVCVCFYPLQLESELHFRSCNLSAFDQ